MFTIIVLILTLSVLVFVHELGHFLAAKWAGVRVDEFAIGMGPRIVRLWNDGETDYTLRAVPMGGFVKLLGEDGLPEDATEQEKARAFSSKSPLKRAIILTAGITMNFLTAVVVIAIVFAGLGKPQVTTSMLIDDVVKNSPAEQAGILPQTYLVGYREVPTEEYANADDVDKFVDFIDSNRGETVQFLLQNDQDDITNRYEATVTLRSEHPENEGPLGIGFMASYIVEYEKLAWWRIPSESLDTSVRLTGAILSAFSDMIRNLVVNREVPTDIAGPIGVAKLTSEAAEQGLYEYLQFFALISINLAIVNILPFPALDGGRLVFVIIEGVTRKKVLKEYEGWIHTIGFLILIGLVILISIYDIQRFF